MQHAMAMDPAPGAPTGAISPSDTGNTQAPQADTHLPQAKSPDNQPKRFTRIEDNTRLGVIQIITGLVHIGLGALSIEITVPGSSIPSVTIGGYPFWGGAIFIVSGYMTIFATNYSWSLMELSLGFNLASAVVTVIGIILYLFQLLDYSQENYEYDIRKHMAKVLSVMLCSILIFLSFLEFCMALWSAYIEEYYRTSGPIAAPYMYRIAMIPVGGNPNPPTHKKDSPA